MTKPKHPRQARRPQGAARNELRDEGLILERPDGYYWQAEQDGPAFGPFESYELARADQRMGEESLAPAETLPEIEDEIGIAAWIDPETGAPAEGQSPPHLSEP